MDSPPVEDTIADEQEKTDELVIDLTVQSPPSPALPTLGDCTPTDHSTFHCTETLDDSMSSTIAQVDDNDEYKNELTGSHMTGDKTPFIFRVKRPAPDVFPETPRRRFKVKRGLYKCTPVTTCTVHTLEQRWNGEVPTTFFSQEKQENFLTMRNSINPDDVLLMSEYVIGSKMLVRLCLFKDSALDIDRRIILSIKAGENEILVSANEFLDKVVEAIDDGFLKKCFIPHEETDEMKLASNLFADFYSDNCGRWCVLRQYTENKYLKDKIYLSGLTWVDFKKIYLLVYHGYKFYSNLVLGSHPYVEKLTEETSS